jgi:hypothetical protein
VRLQAQDAARRYFSPLAGAPWELSGTSLCLTMPDAFHSGTDHGGSMAKGDQRNDKMTKKPKKDTSPPKPPSTSDRPTPPMTTVPVRGKLKNK